MIYKLKKKTSPQGPEITGITILVGTFGLHREYQVHTNKHTHSLIIVITSRIFISTELHVEMIKNQTNYNKVFLAIFYFHRSRNAIVKMVLKFLGPVI